MQRFVISYQPIPLDIKTLETLQRLEQQDELSPPPHAAFVDAEDETDALIRFVKDDARRVQKTRLISHVISWEQVS